MVKRKTEEPKIFPQIILLISLLVVLGIYLTNKNENQDLLSRAEDDNAKFCQDHCKPEGKSCDLTTPSTDECCEEVRKTGDPLACPWPQRGYCSIDQCATIPEGVNRQRCGGPRRSWCGECQTHNCPGYGKVIPPTGIPPTIAPVVPTVPSAPTIVPVVPTFEVFPTQKIIPTEIPTVYVIPTSPPIIPIIPTQVIQNPTTQVTYIPVQYPTNPPPVPPTLAPTKIPNILSLPNLLPTKEKIDTFFIKIRTNIFDFFSKILP